MRRAARIVLVLGAGMALLALPGISRSAPAVSEASGEVPHNIGSDVCQTCHADIAERFETNPHHGTRAEGAAGPVVACESCHGPGSAHAEAEGDESDPRFHQIRDLRKLTAEKADEVCQSCHRTSEQFHWDSSAHARNKVACRDCHSIHDAKDPGGQMLLQARTATDQCVKCHHDKRAELAHTAHMPIREGGMTCADCHNPHGSPGPHMIRGISNNELCESCHMDKRGPFLWEHPPVREDCVTCHMPHGSNNDKVLASKKPFLCQRCHIATRHPSTLYDRPDLVSN